MAIFVCINFSEFASERAARRLHIRTRIWPRTWLFRFYRMRQIPSVDFSCFGNFSTTHKIDRSGLPIRRRRQIIAHTQKIFFKEQCRCVVETSCAPISVTPLTYAAGGHRPTRSDVTKFIAYKY
ncbi:unnamed protein product [Nesidiocoris tenuis]|uniref:Uncharacterized protein n=1 Tax=Nesidiocoris tenuis TaxID=355587 RepID=A0A6H5GR20_9HEMI|nr:unnamed protein product [Nesidiocoris tenuis]